MYKSQTDMTDAPTLGMWLFLASEAMFFIAMLGAFVVLESTGQQHQLFVHSSQMLSGWVAGGSVIMLAFSSMMLTRRFQLPWIAILMAIVFATLLAGQWLLLLSHHTCVARLGDHAVVLDGSESADGNTLVVNARTVRLKDGFDAHVTTASDFAGTKEYSKFKNQDVLLDLTYGPSRNNFFASYFLMSAAHCVHLVAGLIALLWFMLFRRGRVPAALQNYWHFVNGVGIIGLLVVYFV